MWSQSQSLQFPTRSTRKKQGSEEGETILRKFSLEADPRVPNRNLSEVSIYLASVDYQSGIVRSCDDQRSQRHYRNCVIGWCLQQPLKHHPHQSLRCWSDLIEEFTWKPPTLRNRLISSNIADFLCSWHDTRIWVP